MLRSLIEKTTTWPRNLAHNREILWTMGKREIKQKYKGSALGMAWSGITPILMLLVYTFVFTEIFSAKWPGATSESTAEFGINLFAGLIIFNVFAETLTSSPNAIVANKNLVTKIVFPLEIITAANLVSSLFQALVNLLILSLAVVIVKGGLNIDIVALALAILPIVFNCIGLGWLLATAGVYSRDISHLTAVSTNFILFLSAVFYPITALPQSIQLVAELNPIAAIITNIRIILIAQEEISFIRLLIPCLVSYCFSCMCYVIFKKLSRTFADYV